MQLRRGRNCLQRLCIIPTIYVERHCRQYSLRQHPMNALTKEFLDNGVLLQTVRTLENKDNTTCTSVEKYKEEGTVTRYNTVLVTNFHTWSPLTTWSEACKFPLHKLNNLCILSFPKLSQKVDILYGKRQKIETERTFKVTPSQKTRT